MTVKTYDTFGKYNLIFPIRYLRNFKPYSNFFKILGDDEQNRSNLEKDCSCEKKGIFALLICAIIALGFVLVEYYEDTTLIPVSRNDSWDYLLFTQQWPISYCTAFTEEKKEPITECNFAENKYAWTIHGIWSVFINNQEV